MNYGKVLKNAWKTLWKHKVILWFGSLIMIPSLIMGLVMGGFFFSINEESYPFFFEPYAPAPEINPFLPILFFVFIFGFTIASYAIMTLSFAGVLKGTFDLEGKEEKISFGELWHLTLPYLGRIFGVLFLVFFSIFAFLGVIMLLGLFMGILTGGLGFLCLSPLFLLILPLEALAYIFVSIAAVAVIAEDLGVFDAIVRAREVFKQNFWSWVLMGIILLFIQMGINLIVIFPMQIIQFAFIFSMDFTSVTPPAPSIFFRYFAVFMVLFIPLTSLAQGLGLSYANAAWMLSYLDITKPSEAEIAKE